MKDLGLSLSDASIHVLAPEQDIDHYYLGQAADTHLKGLQEIAGGFAPTPEKTSAAVPTNISPADFRLLQSRMLSNGLAFAEKDTSIQNNVSVVLLIEWKQAAASVCRRRRMGWRVQRRKTERKLERHVGETARQAVESPSRLSQDRPPRQHQRHSAPSRATKAAMKSTKPSEPSVYQILDALLPLPPHGKKPTARAIVSTEREFYAPIPDCNLLVELARRVSNTRNYAKSFSEKKIDPQGIWDTTKARTDKFFEKYEKDFLHQLQPLRTDLEFALAKEPYIDVEIEPKK